MNTSFSLVGVAASRRANSVWLVRPPALAVVSAASACFSALVAATLRPARAAGPLLVARTATTSQKIPQTSQTTAGAETKACRAVGPLPRSDGPSLAGNDRRTTTVGLGQIGAATATARKIAVRP